MIPYTRETVLVDAVGGREYRLLRCLGEGGFGSVYLALVRSAGGLEQRVAVKLLHPDSDAKRQAVERLRDEARVLASLHHPVILVAHDLVQLSDQIALVTEYVEGQDLGEVMADPVDPIPVGALIDVVGQVAGALDAAWSTAGIVHRDVKPANIRIGRHGNVKLLDFGIAKSGIGPARTQTNVVLGSLLYMAPERFERGKPLSPASDVFALGCVLFEGLTKAQLFNRLDAAKMFGHAMTPAAFDENVGQRLMRLESPVIRDLLRQMLIRDPDLRLSSADLPHACDTVQAALPGRETLRTWCRRRRWPELPGDEPPTQSAHRLEERVSEVVPQGKASLAAVPEQNVAVPEDPLALPPDAPGNGGTTMQFADWDHGLDLEARPSNPPPPPPEPPRRHPTRPAPDPNKVLRSVLARAPTLISRPIRKGPPQPVGSGNPPPRVVLARTVPPPRADTSASYDTGTLAPILPPPNPTRWGLVGAAVSVMVMVALLVVVAGIAVSALGLLIASGRDASTGKRAVAPIAAPVNPTPTPKPAPKPTPAPAPPPKPVTVAPAPSTPAPTGQTPPPVRPGGSPAPKAVPEVVAPEPEVVPEPTFGSVRLKTPRPFELRSGGQITRLGDRVPVGTYEMFVDFGKGWISGGTVTVTADSDIVVDCNSITWVCTAN